jgi:hypothetical protein
MRPLSPHERVVFSYTHGPVDPRARLALTSSGHVRVEQREAAAEALARLRGVSTAAAFQEGGPTREGTIPPEAHYREADDQTFSCGSSRVFASGRRLWRKRR